jgi:superfamily II DNA/RNA helicase
VLELFKQGKINTLVSTAIGEEGLDIGEVDLIVNFDSEASPTRLVQRMGRTGFASPVTPVFSLAHLFDAYRTEARRACCCAFDAGPGGVGL